MIGRVTFLLFFTSCYCPEFIYGVFFNKYDKDIDYLVCKVDNGKQIWKIQSPLVVNESQIISIISHNDSVTHIFGKCIYNIPTNDKNVTMEFFFYKSSEFQYYGMTNSPYYQVNVKIIDWGIVEYYIFALP